MVLKWPLPEWGEKYPRFLILGRATEVDIKIDGSINLEEFEAMTVRCLGTITVHLIEEYKLLRGRNPELEKLLDEKKDFKSI